MSDLPAASAPSRAGELLKGAFWPALLALAGLLTEPLFERWDLAHDNLNPGNKFIPVTLGLAIFGSIGLTIYFFATRRRTRAAGVITGFVATPFLGFALLLAALKLNLFTFGPR